MMEKMELIKQQTKNIFKNIDMMETIEELYSEIIEIIKVLDSLNIPKIVTDKKYYKYTLLERITMLKNKYINSIKERANLIEMLGWNETDDIQTIYNEIKNHRTINKITEEIAKKVYNDDN